MLDLIHVRRELIIGYDLRQLGETLPRVQKAAGVKDLVFDGALLHGDLLLAIVVEFVVHVVDKLVQFTTTEALSHSFTDLVEAHKVVVDREMSGKCIVHFGTIVDLLLDLHAPVCQFAHLCVVFLHSVVLSLFDSLGQVGHLNLSVFHRTSKLAFVQ